MKLLNAKELSLSLLLGLAIWITTPKALETADVVGDWVPVVGSAKDTEGAKIHIEANGSFEVSNVPCYFVKSTFGPLQAGQFCNDKGRWRLPPDETDKVFMGGASGFSLRSDRKGLRLNHFSIDSDVHVKLERVR